MQSRTRQPVSHHPPTLRLVPVRAVPRSVRPPAKECKAARPAVPDLTCSSETLLVAALDYCAAVLVQCQVSAGTGSHDRIVLQPMAAAAGVLAQIDQARADLGAILNWLSTAESGVPSSSATQFPSGIRSPCALETIACALSMYLEALQSSAEMQLACEFGASILMQGDEALAGLCRQFETRLELAAALLSRIRAMLTRRPDGVPLPA